MRVVIDTNVLVSAMISPNGLPAGVVKVARNYRAVPYFDRRIFAEYRSVLTRESLSLNAAAVDELLNFIEFAGHSVSSAPLPIQLPDPTDQMFIEVAAASQVDFLITGNMKHFPVEARAGVPVVSPREFFDIVQLQ